MWMVSKQRVFAMNCAFQLSAYQIENIAVAQNERFDPKLPEHTGDISASINIAPHKSDKTKYRLTLEIQVKPTVDKESVFFPYGIAIKGRGFFTFKEPCEPEQADHVLRLNGAAMLYGLLRGQVSQITAQAVHGQFLLPTFNFVELDEQSRATGESAKRPAGAKTTTRKPSKRARKGAQP